MATRPTIDGVVAVIPQGPCLLVIRRARHVVAPGMFCFPGGHLEGNETEPDGLVREMHEELGVAVQPRRRIWESVTPWDVSLAWWLCDSLTVKPTPNPLEIESVHWLERGEMEQLPDLLESNQHFLSAWKQGEFNLR